LEISWIASFSLLEGGVTVLRLTLGTPGGVSITRGDRGAGLQLGDEKSAMKIFKKIRLKPLSEKQKIGHLREGVQYSCGCRHDAFWDTQAGLLCENKIKSVKISLNFNFIRF